MNNRHDMNLRLDQVEGLEGRLALLLAAKLSAAAEALPHDITERLRFSRERAIAHGRAVREIPVSAPTIVVSGTSAVLSGPPTWWLRMASWMPLVVVVVGLVLIQKHHEQVQIVTAADVDAALLADELPPSAYRDPGFTVFLQGHTKP